MLPRITHTIRKLLVKANSCVVGYLETIQSLVINKGGIVSPDVFIEDFERTEHSDYLHGVIGRSLIIATRFDSICVSLAMAADLKGSIISLTLREEDFNVVVNRVTSKYRTLNNSIQSFKQPAEISSILHEARNARNAIVHSLTKGLEGCIDRRVNEDAFKIEVSDSIKIVAEGDLVISFLMSAFSNEPIPNLEYLSEYKNKIVNWVVEQ